MSQYYRCPGLFLSWARPGRFSLGDLSVYETVTFWNKPADVNARRLIEADAEPLNQNLQCDMVREYHRERSHCEAFGCCSVGCGESNIVKTYTGRTVCRWTYQPCPTFTLGPLFELFSIINGETR